MAAAVDVHAVCCGACSIVVPGSFLSKCILTLQYIVVVPGAVIDVYAEWCGACTSVVPLVRKIKMEKSPDSDRLVQFLSVSIPVKCVLSPWCCVCVCSWKRVAACVQIRFIGRWQVAACLQIL